MFPLAMPNDLGAFLKEPIDNQDATALLLLDIASGMVRDFLQIGEISAVLADVVMLDLVGDSAVFLPELPVTAVMLVETFNGVAWSTADPATYTVNLRLGIITVVPWTGVAWPTDPETWRVTYSHGFTQIPSSLVGVVLGVAARAWENPVTVASETFGPHTVKYQVEAGGFTSLELKALSRYSNPRVA